MDKALFILIPGAISIIGLLTFINPKMTSSWYVNQGNKTKATITPNLMVSRIMGLVAFFFGIIFILNAFSVIK